MKDSSRSIRIDSVSLVPMVVGDFHPGSIIPKNTVIPCPCKHSDPTLQTALKLLSDRHPGTVLERHHDCPVERILHGIVRWVGVNSGEALVLDVDPKSLTVCFTDAIGLSTTVDVLTYDLLAPRYAGARQRQLLQMELESLGGEKNPQAVRRFNEVVDAVVMVVNAAIRDDLPVYIDANWSAFQRKLIDSLSLDRELSLKYPDNE